MKKLLFILITLLFYVPVHADLLERIRLEEALKERLVDTFKMYDDSAKILIHLEYQSYEGALPGMNFSNNEKIAPDKIELADISKATIDIYSSLEKLPDGAKEAIEKAVPVEDKKRISINFTKVDTNAFSKPIEVKDLSQIVEKTIASFTKLFIFFVILGGGIAFFAYRQSTKRINEFRAHFKQLTDAIADSGNKAPMMPTAAANNQRNEPQQIQLTQSKSTLEKLSTNSLKAIFSDAYWCEMDGYAHWLWKNIEGEQKSELMADLSFMKEYSLYFADVAPVQKSFHEHPYYLEAGNFYMISQTDLAQLVKKDLGMWHAISPMRKQALELSLDEKLKAIQTRPSKEKASASIKSTLRVLDTKPSWGELTNEDESALFNNPEMVPDQMKQHIRSLVWLAQKDKQHIQKVLSKYDAQSLASAWVGSEEVLKNLESNIPEKKLKLLQSYKEKVRPSRQSAIYQLLVDEGLKNEAA